MNPTCSNCGTPIVWVDHPDVPGAGWWQHRIDGARWCPVSLDRAKLVEPIIGSPLSNR